MGADGEGGSSSSFAEAPSTEEEGGAGVGDEGDGLNLYYREDGFGDDSMDIGAF